MDILGIGNALLDIFWFSDDESALSLGLHPNYSAHVSPERLDEILLAVPAPIQVAGGSASNSLKAASALGASSTFIGCTGTEDCECDRSARIFSADLASFGVKCLLENRNMPTGRCLVIHMPGGMKSIACAPAAAPTLAVEQIADETFSQAKLILLDGQTLRNEEITGRVAALCREHGLPLALDVGSADLVRNYGKTILDLMTQNDLILFMNDDETLAMARGLEPLVPGDRGIQTPDRMINDVFSFFTARKRSFPCIVQKRGPKGARAWMSGKQTDIPTEALTMVLDDTGAGDTFNGAFLAAWLKKLPLADCIRFANAAARESLYVPGTRLDWDRFSDLKAELEAIAKSADETGAHPV